MELLVTWHINIEVVPTKFSKYLPSCTITYNFAYADHHPGTKLLFHKKKILKLSKDSLSN